MLGNRSSWISQLVLINVFRLNPCRYLRLLGHPRTQHARTSNQTVVARIKPRNSQTALAFPEFYSTVRNAMSFYYKIAFPVYVSLLVKS